jgi:transposase
MAKPLSEDLRIRLIQAVEGGLSRRAAAERFGVSAASAVRFVSEWRQNGATSAKPQGGDQRSHRIEAFREMILSAIKAKPDMTLVEIAEMLEAETGASFAPSSVWRFLDRHAITFKKPRTQPSRTGPTSPPPARLGVNLRHVSIPTSWYSSTRPVPRPRWPAFTAAPGAAAAAVPRSRTAIG